MERTVEFECGESGKQFMVTVNKDLIIMFEPCLGVLPGNTPKTRIYFLDNFKIMVNHDYDEVREMLRCQRG